jgi:hypothetical protein
MAEQDPITEGPILYEFTSSTNEAPPGTPAEPRPPGRPRPIGLAQSPSDVDAAFARELADRVLEYVRNQPTGLSATQLAALVQDLLTRRSA